MAGGIPIEFESCREITRVDKTGRWCTHTRTHTRQLIHDRSRCCHGLSLILTYAVRSPQNRMRSSLIIVAREWKFNLKRVKKIYWHQSHTLGTYYTTEHYYTTVDDIDLYWNVIATLILYVFFHTRFTCVERRHVSKTMHHRPTTLTYYTTGFDIPFTRIIIVGIIINQYIPATPISISCWWFKSSSSDFSRHSGSILDSRDITRESGPLKILT